MDIVAATSSAIIAFVAWCAVAVVAVVGGLVWRGHHNRKKAQLSQEDDLSI